MRYRASQGVHVFGDKIEKVWKLKKWTGWQDPDKDVLFFGMYDKNDYDVYNSFNGKKTIFWCGSDVPRMLMSQECIRVVKEDPGATHWVETIAQANELMKVGIDAHVAPSFLEDINDFPVSFKPSDKPHIYLSGHPNREGEYGFDLAKRMAIRFPQVTFHLYGVDKSDDRNDCPKNVIYHGWVQNKQFNEEIKNYQGCIRANKHDGNSEIPMKAILMGQYPMTYLPLQPYECAWQYRTDDELATLIQKLIDTKEPNLKARNYWRENLNQFPWVKK